MEVFPEILGYVGNISSDNLGENIYMALRRDFIGNYQEFIIPFDISYEQPAIFRRLANNRLSVRT